jgi:hypothetical protein
MATKRRAHSPSRYRPCRHSRSRST